MMYRWKKELKKKDSSDIPAVFLGLPVWGPYFQSFYA